MPGVSLDQAQLQTRVNWLKNTGPISFQNFRYSGLFQQQTDQNGVLWINFVPAFDTEVLGFSCTLDYSGGIRRWITGYQAITRIGFQAAIWDPYNLAPVGNTVVGLYFIAVGR